MVVPFNEQASFYDNDLFEGPTENEIRVPCVQQMVNIVEHTYPYDEQPVSHRTRSHQNNFEDEREQMRLRVQARRQASNTPQVQVEGSTQQHQQLDATDVTNQDQGPVLALIPTQTQVVEQQMTITEPDNVEESYSNAQYQREQTQFQNVQMNIAQTVVINQQQYWNNHTTQPGQDFLSQVEQVVQHLRERVEYSVGLTDDLRRQSHNAFSHLQIMCDQGNRGSMENLNQISNLRNQTKSLAQQIQASLTELFQRDEQVRLSVNNFVETQRQRNQKAERLSIEVLSQQQTTLSLDNQMVAISENTRNLTLQVDEHTLKLLELNSKQLELEQTQQRIQQTEQDVGRVQSEVQRAFQKQSSFQITLENLQNDTRDLSESVGNLQDQIMKLQSTSRSGFQNEVTELQKQLANLRVERNRQYPSSASPTNLQVETLAAELADLRIQLTNQKGDFENKASQQQSDMDTLFNIVHDVDEKCNRLESRLETQNQNEKILTADILRRLQLLEQNSKPIFIGPRPPPPPLAPQQGFQIPSQNTSQAHRQASMGSQGSQSTFSPYNTPRPRAQNFEDVIFQQGRPQTPRRYQLWYDQATTAPSTVQQTDREPYYQQLGVMEFNQSNQHSANPPTFSQNDDSDYMRFKFNEQFDGDSTRAFIWLDRFLTQVNKHHLTQDQIFAQIRYLLTQAAASWFSEYENTHGFSDVHHFLQEFERQYSVDQLKLHTKFHQTNRKPNEKPQEYLDRLRQLAIPAKISTNIVKEKFLLSIVQDYPNLDPFTVRKIQSDPTISTQDIVQILDDFKDSQEFQKLVARNSSSKPSTSWTSKKSGGGKGKTDKDKANADSSKNADPKTGDKDFRNKKKFQRKPNKGRANAIMKVVKIGDQLCKLTPLTEDDQDHIDFLHDSGDASDPPDCVDDPESDDESSSSQKPNENDDPPTANTIKLEPQNGLENHEIEYYPLSGSQQVTTLFNPVAIQEEIEPDVEIYDQPLDPAQYKMQEECIALEYKAQKAVESRNRKLQQYSLKYGSNNDKNPRKWEDQKKKYPSGQPQQPLWRINEDFISNSPKHYLMMVRHVVRLLDRSNNFLRNEQSLAQANKWVETMQRRYESLVASSTGTVSTYNATGVQTINALTLANTSNRTHLPWQGQQQDVSKNVSQIVESPIMVNQQADVSSQTLEITRAAESAPLLYAKVRMKGQNIFAMLDTGATLSCTTMATVETFGLQSQIQPCYYDVVVMDDRRVTVTQELRDVVIQIDESFAIRTNLIISGTANWSLLLGRNVQEAMTAFICGERLYYRPPTDVKFRIAKLYAQRWRRREKDNK